MKTKAMSATDTLSLPDYAPVPRSAIGPALNERGYYVGRVAGNLYWITDGIYQSAFLTTSDGVVLLDAPPTIGHNIQRAVDEIAVCERRDQQGHATSSTPTMTPTTPARRSSSTRTSPASGIRRRDASCCATTTLRARERGDLPGPAVRSRSAANASTSPGTAPTTRPTTSSSTSPTMTR